MASAILLSGGLDSAALAYWKRPGVAITIDYGQLSARGELRASRQIARALKIKHVLIKVPLRELGAGTLINEPEVVGAPTPEWWPFRNQLLITLAAMKCVRLGFRRLIIGTVKTDRRHADGKPQFVEALSKVMRGQELGVSLIAPAIDLTTSELLLRSKIPAELVAWTHSCHRADFACGKCRACLKRRAALSDAGMPLE